MKRKRKLLTFKNWKNKSFMKNTKLSRRHLTTTWSGSCISGKLFQKLDVSVSTPAFWNVQANFEIKALVVKINLAKKLACFETRLETILFYENWYFGCFPGLLESNVSFLGVLKWKITDFLKLFFLHSSTFVWKLWFLIFFRNRFHYTTKIDFVCGLQYYL